ncbi:hypothetical protein AgCh_025931 [Apium graveolens]
MVDNDKPLTYQDAMNSPDSERWLEAKKSEMVEAANGDDYKISLKVFVAAINQTGCHPSYPKEIKNSFLKWMVELASPFAIEVYFKWVLETAANGEQTLKPLLRFAPIVDTTVAINETLILGGVMKKSLPKKTKGSEVCDSWLEVMNSIKTAISYLILMERVIRTIQRHAMDVLINQYVQAANNKLTITDWASHSYVLVIWVPEEYRHYKLALKNKTCCFKVNHELSGFKELMMYDRNPPLLSFEFGSRSLTSLEEQLIERDALLDDIKAHLCKAQQKIEKQ